MKPLLHLNGIQKVPKYLRAKIKPIALICSDAGQKRPYIRAFLSELRGDNPRLPDKKSCDFKSERRKHYLESFLTIDPKYTYTIAWASSPPAYPLTER